MITLEPPRSPLGYVAKELRALLNYSEKQFTRLLEAKELPAPILIGKRRVWPVDVLDGYFTARYHAAGHGYCVPKSMSPADPPPPDANP